MSAAKLPPRKRARTAEEKEQRRVERVIRNRRAAHASREKKRRHVETLEKYVKSLELAMSSNYKLYTDLTNLLPAGSTVSPFQRVTKPADLGGESCENEREDEAEEDYEEEEEEEELNVVVKQEEEEEHDLVVKQEEEYLGLVSPPQTNPQSVFKLPEESILKQNYASLFDDEDEYTSVDLNSNLNIYSTGEEMEGQETETNVDDPLHGLFDSVHPAAM